MSIPVLTYIMDCKVRGSYPRIMGTTTVSHLLAPLKPLPVRRSRQVRNSQRDNVQLVPNNNAAPW